MKNLQKVHGTAETTHSKGLAAAHKATNTARKKILSHVAGAAVPGVSKPLAAQIKIQAAAIKRGSPRE